MDLLKKPLPNQVTDFTDWLAAGAPAGEAIKVNSDVDMGTLLPAALVCSEVQVDFPMFADGRGFSIARLLRREGFTGVIRAVGDVAVDRVSYMQRVGFDAVELKQGEQADLLPQLVNRIQVHYQNSSDGSGPVYKAG